jgi:TRAP-type C4-dicarboxylate transport system substrate-binding protein
MGHWKVLAAHTRRALKVARFAALAGLVVFGSATAAGAQVNSARMVIGQPPQNGQAVGLSLFADYLTEVAGIETEVFLVSLLSLAEIPDGLRDGLADIGNVVTAYKQVEYSETNLIANLSMLATSGENTKNATAAMSGAVMEYVLLNCQECLDQYESMNQVFFGSVSTNPYALLCSAPVTTLADMAGKSIRSGATNFSRWAAHVGASTVTIPGNEMYDAMSQGLIDCTMLAINELIGVSMIDVVNGVLVGVPGGVFAALADNNVNRDFWRSMSDEQRRAYVAGTPRMVADVILAQNRLLEESLAAAEEKGIPVVNADEEMMDNYSAFVAADLPVISAEFRDKHGLKDVDQKIETALGLIEKWKALTAQIDSNDADAMVALYNQEIFSKLDLTTYGLD